jgi:PTH1 family peptidyl-tRNA hydrolase
MIGQRYLLVGLGNPGLPYQLHRHNIGFMLMDVLADKNRLVFSRMRHQALIATGSLADRPVVLAKPQTFMNASGSAVARLARFYRIEPQFLLVAYDDLDLPLGTVRFRAGGGSGGHKGMRSILEQLGEQQFARLRIGIGRPPGRMDPADYVLERFLPAEQELRDVVLQEAAGGAMSFLQGGIELAMSRHNRCVGGTELVNQSVGNSDGT